ncbi:DUF2199 domain-containing protein [Arthrobacter sp. SAFR-044]|uniref:DUF2199 domain-containing protein n=1 Tax=Arthrobacter sp. SAFR-044 TaxID=3387278 RepID=UPI003F7B64F9
MRCHQQERNRINSPSTGPRSQRPKTPSQQKPGQSRERHYFLRGHIEIPLVDAPGEVFSWSAWVSLSQESVQKIADHWDDPARASMPPVFGWLCNELPYDQPTTSLATHVHNREPGVVPCCVLDPSIDHPLVREQQTGISLHRLAQINQALMG